MKTVPWTVYAPTRHKEHWTLPDGLDWKTVQLKVKRLQMRIAARGHGWPETMPKAPEGREAGCEASAAAKLKKYRLMRSLQWLLAHSFYGKLLAVRRVTSNKGKNTPGVDGVVWKTSRQKTNAVKLLYRRGYRATPLRRVYIPKKSGKLRPLGIPTMRDRAMQALYASALAPIAETWADPNSYGFRQRRSCADAISQCFNWLSRRNSATWVLEADISACFDTISHQWILENIPIDKKMLKQWLTAGFLDKGELFPTLKGTPQGGIISPIIMNMTLDGLENIADKSVPWYLPRTGNRTGVAVIRYADDFGIRLNQTIRGWCNYHRHACSSRIFNWFDSWLFWEIKRWLHRRHPNKGRRWIIKKYYRLYRNNLWSFHATQKNADGKNEYRYLLMAGRTRIVRHVKILPPANPYDPAWTDYFTYRNKKKMDISQDGRFVQERGWFLD